MAINSPSSCQRIDWVWDAKDVISFRIERIGVNIYLVAGLISQDEITFPRVIPRYFRVTS